MNVFPLSNEVPLHLNNVSNARRQQGKESSDSTRRETALCRTRGTTKVTTRGDATDDNGASADDARGADDGIETTRTTNARTETTGAHTNTRRAESTRAAPREHDEGRVRKGTYGVAPGLRADGNEILRNESSWRTTIDSSSTTQRATHAAPTDTRSAARPTTTRGADDTGCAR